jgi:hypothetical protein
LAKREIALAKEEGNHSIEEHKDAVGRCMHRFKHKDPKPLHSGRGKSKGKKSEGPVVTDQQQAIAICLSIAEKGGDGYSESSLSKVSDMLGYSDPLIPREKGKNCPRGTIAKGGKWCKVRYPDREFYLQIEDGQNCPSGTEGAGKGYCVGHYSEANYEYL